MRPSARLSAVIAAAVMAWVGFSAPASGQTASRFGAADSRSQYVHRIQLLDANKNVIDPADPAAPPYSPMNTCGKCHDVKTMAHGWHFNYTDPAVDKGRAGEPWFWTDDRTGTQIPLSYRQWVGTYAPKDLNLSPFDFIMRFGHHLPGGGAGELTEPTPGSRWQQSGPLLVDCMMCHSADRSYSPQVWAEQIADMNFAWAPTAAMGLAKVEGSVKSLLPDADPAKPDTMKGKTLPKTVYNPAKFSGDKEVFFDVVRRPTNNSCYYCHSSKPVGPSAAPKWTHDNDVHIKAGLSCVDCHRNGVDHHTVRGYEGEKHPSGVSVASLSCRGCHMGGMGETGSGDKHLALGGRLGAPQPLHRGLPALHLEKLSCTTCHSGELPTHSAEAVWTAMAHGLGLKSQTREAADLPNLVQTVFKPDASGVIHPHRQMWPAFWGVMKDEKVTPLEPDAVYETLRRVLRIRKDFRLEIGSARLTTDERAKVLGDRAKLADADLKPEDKQLVQRASEAKAAKEFREKIAPALKELGSKITDGKAVYVSGGKLYSLGADGRVQSRGDHPAAQPYAWPIAHDVRPARQSLGVNGCVECHTPDSPIFYSRVVATGPAPDDEPLVSSLSTAGVIEPKLLAAWEQSFGGHFAFKILATVCAVIVAAVLLVYFVLGFGGSLRMLDSRCARPKN